jgi:WD40 repeat protein
MGLVRPDDRTVQVVECGEEMARELWRGRHSNVFWTRVSGDGRLMATGSFEGGDGVRIWELETGRLVHELPIGDANVVFGHDGSRLFTTTGRVAPRGEECRAWRVGTWEPEGAVALRRSTSAPAPLTVAPDGLLVVASTMSGVSLLDPTTLSEVAALASPEPGLILGLHFSPDGSTLAVVTSGTVHLWDLRKLREELAGLGLDWDRPPYPPAPKWPPARVEFVPTPGTR